MARGAIGLAVGQDVGDEVFERAGAARHHDGVAELADGGESVGAVGGDADRRMRPLERLGREAHVLAGEELALVGERSLGPGALDERQRLGKARLALGVGDAVGVVGARQAAAADAEDEAAAADLIDGRRLLGHAHGMPERQDLDGSADADAAGAGGDGAGDGERRG